MRMRTLALTLTLACFASLLRGQTYQGGLRGSVKAPAVAVVAVAKIIIQDEAIKVSRATLANDQGEFALKSVNPLTCKLTIESPGFTRLPKTSISIATQTFLTLDFKLNVGDRNPLTSPKRSS